MFQIALGEHARGWDLIELFSRIDRLLGSRLDGTRPLKLHDGKMMPAFCRRQAPYGSHMLAVGFLAKKSVGVEPSVSGDSMKYLQNISLPPGWIQSSPPPDSHYLPREDTGKMS